MIVIFSRRDDVISPSLSLREFSSFSSTQWCSSLFDVFHLYKYWESTTDYLDINQNNIQVHEYTEHTICSVVYVISSPSFWSSSSCYTHWSSSQDASIQLIMITVSLLSPCCLWLETIFYFIFFFVHLSFCQILNTHRDESGDGG